ncbi:hypothetical protein C819_04064 [Lachnospiraceae bacterium 10-1]|nr:hypothetical protein C819_04064 [Lachnospiraceae bacterium 10-1]
MHTKVMEGIVGARTNMDMVDVPMRVYKEARRKGDTATMERAMGYVNEFENKAREYKAEADEGMKEEAEELKENEKLEREESIQKRREEREKFEEKIEENREADTLEVSEEGKVLLKSNTDSNCSDAPKSHSDSAQEPVIYTKTGEASRKEQMSSISVSV